MNEIEGHVSPVDLRWVDIWLILCRFIRDEFVDIVVKDAEHKRNDLMSFLNCSSNCTKNQSFEKNEVEDDCSC